ncbi:hypothetical protein CIB48_g4148 [Xylaria polymorpha]|nr:hypothetical protein CIB48_g4148 [Xylaria polymorpha]
MSGRPELPADDPDDEVVVDDDVLELEVSPMSSSRGYGGAEPELELNEVLRMILALQPASQPVYLLFVRGGRDASQTEPQDCKDRHTSHMRMRCGRGYIAGLTPATAGNVANHTSVLASISSIFTTTSTPLYLDLAPLHEKPNAKERGGKWEMVDGRWQMVELKRDRYMMWIFHFRQHLASLLQHVTCMHASPYLAIGTDSPQRKRRICQDRQVEYARTGKSNTPGQASRIRDVPPILSLGLDQMNRPATS